MALYDGLALNTPTKISDDGVDIEVWATRTANGGTVEYRPKSGGATDLNRQRDARVAAAIPVLRTWASTARSTTATSGNAVAVVNGILANLGTFYDNFADLLQSMGKG